MSGEQSASILVNGCDVGQSVIGVKGQRVGLLSIGEEEVKGNNLTRDAHRLLKESGLRFTGNVEARDLYSGETDVVVCDGFTGNVALKVSEVLIEVVERLLHDELGRNLYDQARLSSFTKVV